MDSPGRLDTLIDDCDFLLELASEAVAERLNPGLNWNAASHAPDAAFSLHGTGYQPSKDIPKSSGPVRTLAQTNPATSGFYVENFTGLKVPAAFPATSSAISPSPHHLCPHPVQVSRPVVGSLVVRERLSDGEFLKLSHLA
ncbi:hypothetical protein QJQ45_012240 [Haematococcus lacustris]|nr:hypothetical protein QJQ45_012240 [Haematococcus lacustris]